MCLIACSLVHGAEETMPPKKRYGQASSCASREATVVSMMGWGIGIFIGIAVLCALLTNNPEKEN